MSLAERRVQEVVEFREFAEEELGVHIRMLGSPWM